jgi:excisionase family DNA binding protein
MNETEILTIDEVAEFLRVTVAQVQHLLEAGDLAGFKVVGEWRIPVVAVLNFLRRAMEAAQREALARSLSDPRTWAEELARMPKLRAAVEEQDFAEDTMGSFLKNALRKLELENKADNVIPIKPKTE